MSSKILVGMGWIICLTLVSAEAQESADNPQPLRFEGYPNAKEMAVVPRKDDLFFYPCMQCHSVMEPNPEIRELNAPHTSDLQHGKGRIWCTSCHDLDDRNNLKTLLDEPVDFDEAHLVCGGCHANRHKDWYFGAHGKRVANWQGDRTLYNCTHCHNAHDPAIKPRAPSAAPPVRRGLELQEGVRHEQVPIWESREEQEEHE